MDCSCSKIGLVVVLGFIKSIIGGLAAIILTTVGCSSIAFSSIPFFFFWICRAFFRSSKLRLFTKIISFLPLVFLILFGSLLTVIVTIIASFFVGAGYGIFLPLISTFEAVGDLRRDKVWYCISGGIFGALKRSWKMILGFHTMCFSSFPDLLKNLDEWQALDNVPKFEFYISRIPWSICIGVIGIVVDFPSFTGIALWKSPCMLLKGWWRLLSDFYILSRDGSCTKLVCIPTSICALIIWPLVVLAAVCGAVVSSIFYGLFGAVIAYQEGSFKFGLAYVISVVAEFDEYTNDLLHLQPGTCLPRFPYRGHSNLADNLLDMTKVYGEQKNNGNSLGKSESMEDLNPAANTEVEKIEKVDLQEVFESKFAVSEKHCEMLIREGAVKASDLEEWLHANRIRRQSLRMVTLGIPAHTILHTLISSINSEKDEFILENGLKISELNADPKHESVTLFFEPLTWIMQQMKVSQLQLEEIKYLEKLVLSCGDLSALENWHNDIAEPDDTLRKGKLKSFARMIGGIVTNIVKYPDFRTRYESMIDSLYSFARTQESSKLIQVDGSLI